MLRCANNLPLPSGITRPKAPPVGGADALRRVVIVGDVGALLHRERALSPKASASGRSPRPSAVALGTLGRPLFAAQNELVKLAGGVFSSGYSHTSYEVEQRM